MARTLDGIMLEKDNIFKSFVLSILFFGIQTMAACFIVMDTIAAWIVNVIMIIGIYYWYDYSLKIYNRFNVTH